MLCGSAGLCGGSASGKTTVANKIIEALDVPWVVLLSMDSFYKVMPVCVFCLYRFGNYYRLSVGLLKEEMCRENLSVILGAFPSQTRSNHCTAVT